MERLPVTESLILSSVDKLIIQNVEKQKNSPKIASENSSIYKIQNSLRFKFRQPTNYYNINAQFSLFKIYLYIVCSLIFPYMITYMMNFEEPKLIQFLQNSIHLHSFMRSVQY